MRVRSSFKDWARQHDVDEGKDSAVPRTRPTEEWRRREELRNFLPLQRSRTAISLNPQGTTESLLDEALSELALAHVEGSATIAAYARDDLLEKRRPLMQAWADCTLTQWTSPAITR